MGRTPLKQNDSVENKIEKNCQEDIIALATILNQNLGLI
jgi:hypothetical protein